MKSGIYLIKNTVDGKVYVGQSIYVRRRIAYHKNHLLNGTDDNSYLQRAVNKYGLQKFEFIMLESVPEEMLDDREKYWISKYNSTNRNLGYNRELGGNKGKIVSEEVREAKRGVKNPMYGVKHSDETLKAMALHSRGMNNKLTAKQVEEIKIRLFNGETQKALADAYGVDVTSINKIQCAKNWGYIRADLNSHLIFQHKISRQKIAQLFSEGISKTEIAKRMGCNIATVCKVTGITFAEEIRRRNAKIAKDFESGIPKQEILKKYGINNHAFWDATSESRAKIENAEKSKAIELRKQGMMVKDIAKRLNRNRTTISKWTMGTPR